MRSRYHSLEALYLKKEAAVDGEEGEPGWSDGSAQRIRNGGSDSAVVQGEAGKCDPPTEETCEAKDF